MSESMLWHNVADWTLEGRGWARTASPFHRLPAHGQALCSQAVWNFGQHSAGLCARFRTNATQITARWLLRDAGVAWGWMPAVGANGLDLYAKDRDGKWYWAGFGNPTPGQAGQECCLTKEFDGEEREYLLYLPVANELKELALRVNEGAVLTPLGPRGGGAIAYYGTSIAHGCACSRPGMTHLSILSRWLDRNVLNLGFAGSALMEIELAGLLAELDPAVWVLDPLPNMTPVLVAERAEAFIRRLREARPGTPIVLVEDRTMPMSRFRPIQRKFHDMRRANYRAIFDKLCGEGMAGLHYIEGEALLGDDSEGTVDNSHPNDLGFFRQAQVIEPVLRKALLNR